MFQAWGDVFRKAGYSLEDLNHAMTVLSQDPPKWRGEHLARIHAVCRRRREQIIRQAAELNRIIGNDQFCPICHDSGVAIVPHLRFVIDGSWVEYPGCQWRPAFGVACKCDAGKRVETRTRKWPIMTLAKYNGLNPAWEKQLIQYRDYKAASVKAASVSRDMDRALGQVLKDRGIKLHQPSDN